jgi:spoIIIJ-associated protein
MSPENTTIEVISSSVDEAIKEGLEKLGLKEDDVEVEVIEKGGRGLFGLGSHQAKVKLTVKESVFQKAKPASESVGEMAGVQTSSAISANLTPEQDHELQVSRVVVETLIEKMKVHAKIQAKYLEPDDKTGERPLFIEVLGDDLSILIGRHSETLNAIQYISSLIICRELGKWVPILIDIQGYRERRERQLRQLAKRMAEQAISTGRRQVLEPMPANERRVIHLELREHPEVETLSIGEEPNRKVTIVPRNKK